MKAILIRLLMGRRSRFGLALIACLVFAAVLSPLIVEYSPTEQLGLALQSQPPSAAHPLGTDLVSRDLLSRVLSGMRLSLTIALLSVFISVTVGTGVGLTAGYLGGVVDICLMRTVDAALAVPRVLLLLVVLIILPPTVLSLVAVLGLTSWFGTSRVVRAEVLSIKQREFVVAASALGLSRFQTVLKHLLPNVIAPVIVTATLGMGHIILIEAGLSFLGAGVQPPTASLGGIISDGVYRLDDAWWISTFPGLAILFIVVGFSLIGDGLRDAVDTRTQ
ncbi:MAG: ABC transporter permease [Myxococcota bacterium]|nr:ABC transporter permease [Myxococcota bacterium]